MTKIKAAAVGQLQPKKRVLVEDELACEVSPEESGKIGNQASTQSHLPEEVAIMDIILRFLQLLCENHNGDLQNYLRVQPNNKTSYNLVCQTLQFLDCICGSTTGGLGLLGLWINEHNVHLINQTLESLTEYCQGPCHENQVGLILYLNLFKILQVLISILFFFLVRNYKPRIEWN